MIAAAPPNNRLVLTTEALSELGWRVLRLLFFGGLAAAVTRVGHAGRERTIDFQAVLALALIQLFVVGAGVFWILSRGSVQNRAGRQMFG